MNKADDLGYIKQAQSELNQRITRTIEICKQFKNSYSGYTSLAKQIFFLALLAIPASLLIWTASNINVILSIFSTQNYDRDSLLLKISLAGIGLYILLHTYRMIIHIFRISRINGHVFVIQNKIEKHLQKNLSNLSNIAAEANKQIWGGTNVKINPKDDVDAEIAKYSSIAKTYSNPDDNTLGVALTITHWLSGLLLVGAFLLISTHFFAEKIGEWLNVKEYALIALVYITPSFSLFMIIQELFARNNISHLHTGIKNVSCILAIVGVYGILLFCVFGFNSFLVNYHYDFWRTIFALCIPIAIATFCSSILSIISKIENRKFGIIVICTGIVYTIILLSLISDIRNFSIFSHLLEISEAINTVVRVIIIIAAIIVLIVSLSSGLIGVIIVVVCAIIAYNLVKYVVFVLIGLLAFSLIAIIPLFPGLILLFIDSRSSRRSHITSIVLFSAITIAGFFLIKSNLDFISTPHAAAEAQIDTAKNVTVISNALNLRAGPSINTEILKVLHKGDVLTVTGDASGGWTPIEHENVRGWVSSELIE